MFFKMPSDDNADDLEALRIKSATESSINRTPLPASYRDKSSEVNSYSASEKLLDLTLFALSCWSQFGYATFSNAVSCSSLQDPLEHYVFPHISESSKAMTLLILQNTIKTFSYADAILTTGSYINMRKCRNDFISGIKKGWRSYKNNEINQTLLVSNFVLIFTAFITGSFSPWTGLILDNYSPTMSNSSGPFMFTGLIISYTMSNAPYIFSMTHDIGKLSFSDLTQIKQTLKNIFLTKKGLLGFLPRTIINLVNRGWNFYGISLLTMKYIFKCDNPFIVYPYSVISAISSSYQTATSQGFKDYKICFEEKPDNPDNKQDQKIIKIDQSLNATDCMKGTLKSMLFLVTSAVFILRTLTVPSLYTGEIDDPENNYTTLDTCVAVLGLIFGAFAAYQYSQFRYSRWKENFSALFKSEEGSSEKEPLLPANNSNEGYSLNK